MPEHPSTGERWGRMTCASGNVKSPPRFFPGKNASSGSAARTPASAALRPFSPERGSCAGTTTRPPRKSKLPVPHEHRPPPQSARRPSLSAIREKSRPEFSGRLFRFAPHGSGRAARRAQGADARSGYHPEDAPAAQRQVQGRASPAPPHKFSVPRAYPSAAFPGIPRSGCAGRPR